MLLGALVSKLTPFHSFSFFLLRTVFVSLLFLQSVTAAPSLSIMFMSLSPALRLAEHDSELPLLFISFEFIRQLIPVARVGGGYSAGSVAISRSVL